MNLVAGIRSVAARARLCVAASAACSGANTWHASSVQLACTNDRVASGMLCPLRRFQSTLSTADQEDRMVAINTCFAEARDEIEYALEDAETTYFNESATTAQEAVKKTLDMYGELLALANEDDRARIQRSMGLKMEQLKAEVKQLDSLHA